MIGRAASDTPWLFSTVDTAIYGSEEDPATTRDEVVRKYAEYLETVQDKEPSQSLLLKPILNLYHAQIGGRHFRRLLSQTIERHAPATPSSLLNSTLDSLVEVRERKLANQSAGEKGCEDEERELEGARM
eukprot:Colp12_sorted_trinity150504_noHs@6766